MTQVGNILDSYAYKQRYISYGFGGIPRYIRPEDMARDERFINLDK